MLCWRWLVGGDKTAVAVAVSVYTLIIDRHQTAGGQELTPGGLYTSSRSAYNTLKPLASVLLLRLLSLNSSVELIGCRIDSSTRLGRYELQYTMTERAATSLGQILASKYSPQTTSRQTRGLLGSTLRNSPRLCHYQTDLRHQSLRRSLVL